MLRPLLAGLLLTIAGSAVAGKAPHNDITLDELHRVLECVDRKKCKKLPKRITVKRISDNTQIAVGYSKGVGIVLEIHKRF